MNAPESESNTGLIAGVVFLFGGTLALVTGQASYKGGYIEGPLATFVGISFIVFGVVFLGLHIRHRTRKR